MINGHVDIIRRDSISGWVADYDDPNRVVEIAVYVDRVERGRYPANRSRPDLRALRIYGDGNHGFAIELTPPLSSDADHELMVRPLWGQGTLERGYCRIAKDTIGEQAITVIDDRLNPAQLTGVGTPRYVIHIGPHKTGTTYLQSAFSQSQHELRAGGVFYPDTAFGWIEPDGNSQTVLYRNLRALETRVLPADFDRLAASAYNTILISSEDLVDLSRQSLRYLRSLVAGRPVEIVYYCRRWSELLPSAWQESVKQGKVHSLGELLAAQLGDPMKSRIINFDVVLSEYAEVFGIDSIKLVSYSHLVDSKTDLYDHFVRSVLGWDKVPSVTRVTPNRSIDPVDVETVRLLNEVATVRSEPVGVSIFHDYWRNRSNADVLALHTAMAKCLTSIRVNDAAPGLRAVHDFNFQKYGGCMVDPASGYNLFLPKVQDLPFVQTSYLLADEIVRSVTKIYEEICRPDLPNP